MMWLQDAQHEQNLRAMLQLIVQIMRQWQLRRPTLTGPGLA